MIKLEKIRVTLDHGIYGRPEADAWGAGGVCVHKLFGRGNSWTVAHVASGRGMAGKHDSRRTKAGAVMQLEALIALPIDWTLPAADLEEPMRANCTAIRMACGVGRGK